LISCIFSSYSELIITASSSVIILIPAFSNRFSRLAATPPVGATISASLSISFIFFAASELKSPVSTDFYKFSKNGDSAINLLF